MVMMVPSDVVMASENSTVNVTHVYATYCETENVDVLYQLMEVESGMITTIDLNVEIEGSVSNPNFKVFQYVKSSNTRYDLASSKSKSFSIYTDELRKDIPLYLAVYDGNKLLCTKLLVIRVNQGRAETMVVSEVGSEYKDNLEVNMDELLPGMKFEMYPYFIPITAKAYTDGRVVMAMGINTTNVSFWKDARNGTVAKNADIKELSDAFWGNSSNRSAVTGGNMGLVVNFSGWVMGNLYTNEPLTGELSLYVGSGFYIKGQYAILTYDVTVTAGAAGVLDFEFQYNKEKSKYDKFVVDSFSMQFSAALELYGGLGLSSIFSVGLYGAGSITLKDQFYPVGVVQSILLAGELGFKVKLFGRSLFAFALLSGSHEFVKDRLSSGGSGGALLGVSQLDAVGNNLRAMNYADVAASVSEPDDIGTWYTDMTPSNLLQGYETDPDFDHMIAEDVYPDNKLKTVKTATGNFPQINVVFLGSDGSRENGNRSRLMNFYYNEATNFISDPMWVLDNSIDDGTADYNPEVFHSDLLNRTYLIWQNAVAQPTDESTFRDIAKSTDLYFAELNVGGDWKNVSRITNFASDTESEKFASGAKVWEDWDGEPLVTYFTNDASDPIASDTSASHDIYVARMQDGEWVNEKAFTVNGQVTDVCCAYFHKNHTIAVCYNKESAETSTGKIYTMELWQDTDGVWTKTLTRTGKDGGILTSAKYIKSYRNQNVLTWYEDSCVYRMVNETNDAVPMTSSSTPVPSPDYEIYGNYLNGPIVVVGNRSKDASANAFAVYSPTGGALWSRLDLTDIDEYALVNGLSISFTDENEPLIFYSVQNYKLNDSLDLSYLHQDTETLLASPLKGSFGGLGSGLMVGQDDPRFIDTHTDLYVKARRANQRVRINDIKFTDVPGAKKGANTPATVTLENNGMYNIESVTLYSDGNKLGDYDIFIKPGETKTLNISLLVPSDAEDKPIDYYIEASCREDIIDSGYTATLSPGEVSVVFSQQLLYGNESLFYTLSTQGFANRWVTIYLFDQDSGELFYTYPTAIPCGQNVTGRTSLVSGLFTQMGHTNIKAFVLDNEESARVPKSVTLEEFEELMQLPSTRTYTFKGLDTIYLQDVSKALKTSNESKPQEQSQNSSSNNSGASNNSSSGSSGYSNSNNTETSEPSENTETSGKDGKDSGNDASSTPAPNPSPTPSSEESSADIKTDEPKKQSGIGWIIALIAGIGMGLLFLFWKKKHWFLILFKRRKDEEEEEVDENAEKTEEKEE